MGLIQLKAPACEPITLSEAKNYLRIDHDDEDQLLESMIKAARQSVESYTVCSLIKQSWRFTFNNSLTHAHGDRHYISGVKNFFEYGIELPRSPFIKIEEPPKVIHDFASQTIKSFRIDTSGRLAKLYVSPTILNFAAAPGTIQIDYWTGYGETPDQVPEPLRQAIYMMLAQLYNQHTGANDNGFMTVPLTDSVLQILKPYRTFRLQ